MSAIDLNDLIKYIKTDHGDKIQQKQTDFYNDLVNDEGLMRQRPWKQDVKYFTGIKISCLAVLKMAKHAIEGGNVEIMGMLVGKIYGHSIIINDVYALPVEGTETRVNAQLEGYEYMVSYLQQHKLIKTKENIVGWYHSHPGYGCYLSGIDIATQSLNQNFQDPYVAIVIDPIKSLKAGKIEIGAFRTYPDNYNNSNNNALEGGNEKEKFGIYANKYYALDIEIFQLQLETELIKLINQETWVNELIVNEEVMNTEVLNKNIAINEIRQQLNQRIDKGHFFKSSYRMFDSIFRNTMNQSNPRDKLTMNHQGPQELMGNDMLYRSVRQIRSPRGHGKSRRIEDKSIYREREEEEDGEEDANEDDEDDVDEDEEEEDDEEDEEDEEDNEGEEEDDENEDNDVNEKANDYSSSTDNVSLRPRGSRKPELNPQVSLNRNNQLLKLCNEVSTNELKDIMKYDLQEKLFS